MSRLLLVALLAIAGGCSSKPKTDTTGAGSAPEPAPPPPPGTDLAKLGSECAADGKCPVGSCVTYFGIAGPKGGEFKSCEIKCTEGTACPEGTTCQTIADGPGQVCRAAAAK